MPVCTKCGTAYGSTVRICVRDGTPLVADRADDRYLGTLLDGKYRIDAFINAGGMGSLYRALHVMLDKTVAVKVIRNELVTSDEVVARFQREARAASNLEHPNIVSVYDLGQTPDGTLYIAMEFIDGPSLKEVIRRDGPLTPRDTIDILRQVAGALSSAHRKQIVHRDLKSDNLMLETEDGRRVVKLVDFGIAKTFDDSTQLTAAGYMLGTPNYMSPEQAAGKPVDHRTDLYSLGVILYEMLTGKVPFGDTALTSLLVKLATEVPPPPSARRPDGHVPPALDAVAMRCLEKEPERRFQSADEFAIALDNAAAEIDGVAATPVPPMLPADRTLLRPSPTRQTGMPTASVTTTATVETGQQVSVPAARPRTGLSAAALTLRIAAGLLVLAGIAAAVVFGLRPSKNTPQETPASAAIPQPDPSPAPAPALTPPPVAAVPETNISASAAPARPSASIDEGRARVPAASSSVSRSSGSPPGRAPESTPPRLSSIPDRTPPSTGPVTSPAPTPQPPASTGPPPPARVAPSVSVTCQGSADVCGVIRSEIVQALQNDQVTVDVEIAVKVAVVSERPSTQFGTPSTVRTISVDLTGSSRGAALAMPPSRVFAFDALFGRSTLQENARQLASGTVEAVRAFTKGRN